MSYTDHQMIKWSLFKLLNNTLSQIKVCNKAFYIAGNFNLNLLDHDTNKKVQNFLDLFYQTAYATFL